MDDDDDDDVPPTRCKPSILGDFGGAAAAAARGGRCGRSWWGGSSLRPSSTAAPAPATSTNDGWDLVLTLVRICPPGGGGWLVCGIAMTEAWEDPPWMHRKRRPHEGRYPSQLNPMTLDKFRQSLQVAGGGNELSGVGSGGVR
jgi:hypothetical protein